MSTKQNSDKELIYKFLNNTLNEDEKKEFVSKQQNVQFSELLARIIVEQKGRIELKNTLKTISKQHLKTKSTKKRIIRFSIASSAVAAILITALFVFNVHDSADLFQDNFEPFPNVYAAKGSHNHENSKLKAALQLYDAEAYEEAILKFEQLNGNDLKGYVRLYYGISLLAVNEIEASKQTLNLLGHDDSVYNEGQWYLGLAYLKQDSLNKAKTIFINTKDSFGKSKKDQIEVLLEEINKIN